MTKINIESEKNSIINYKYDRANCTSGIVHIGIGNFHRAHQQFYTNQLLENPTQHNWGICGVALLPSDEKLIKSLEKQNGEYTLTVCGGNSDNKIYTIGSLIELIWGVENPNAVIDKIARPTTKIITLTITEGGYNIDNTSKKFMLEEPSILHDIQNPENPKTVFGFIAAGLRKRMNAGQEGITILSCDNLQHNGDTAKYAFTAFLEKQDSQLKEWASNNVSFPNSMVDRITPATKPEDVIWLNEQNNTNDEVPVYCEDFIQWVIEDNFIAGRPQWEDVGVEFTDDVSTYENMKLSLLNASHTLLSYPSFLAGFRKVDEAMNNELILKLLKDFMDIDITPYVPAPKNTDLEIYKATLLERFANPAVSDQVSRLCFDGISKFPVYIVPNLTKMIADNKDLTRVAFLIASYRAYLKNKIDDNGAAYEIGEPWLTNEEYAFVENENPEAFLNFKPFKGCPLASSQNFMQLYLNFVKEINDQDTLSVLKTIV